MVWFVGRSEWGKHFSTSVWLGVFSPVFGWEVLGQGHFCSGIFLKYVDSSVPSNRVDEAIPCGPRRAIYCLEIFKYDL